MNSHYCLTSSDQRDLKPQRMITRKFLNRLIIFGFMILVGLCLARGIYYQSVLAITLACISLFAGVYFLYLLTNAKREMEKEETN